MRILTLKLDLRIPDRLYKEFKDKTAGNCTPMNAIDICLDEFATRLTNYGMTLEQTSSNLVWAPDNLFDLIDRIPVK
jgi:hypothetical protein